MRQLLRAALLAVVPVATLHAQAVRGVVVDPTDRPVSGVVLLLVDARSREVARSLTGESGQFRLDAPAPGAYRVRTLHIGFRSHTSELFELGADAVMTLRIVLSNVPFSLDTIRTLGRNPCRVLAADSLSMTMALWEQARAALTAAQLTAAGRTLMMTTQGYDRTLDVGARRVRQQSTDFRTDFVQQPWRSRSPDSLRRFGYVATDAQESRVYYAPGFEALLSGEFLEDHCMRASLSGDSTRIAINFEPTGDRKNIPEIRGALSLDRKSMELRSMEYSYVNVPRDEQQTAGGDMQFVRMANGMWVISRWNIRMPMLVLVPVYRTTAIGPVEVAKESRLDSIRVTGGEVVVAMLSTSKGRDTLWARPRLDFTGSVSDSASGRAVANATIDIVGTHLRAITDSAGRFVISEMLPGRYVVRVHTPSLDSLNAVNETSVAFSDSAAPILLRVPTASQIAQSLCPNVRGTASRPRPGILMGAVDVPGDSMPPGNVKVVAEWREVFLQPGGTACKGHHCISEMGFFYGEPFVADARTDTRGSFRICGVPVGTSITVHATTDSASSAWTRVSIGSGERFARVDLALDQQVAAGGMLVGLVVSDTGGDPIAGADVSLSDMALSTRTDSTGAFRLVGIQAGSHQFVVRRLGYGPLDARLDFGRNEAINRRIVLGRVILLDSVVTSATRRDPEMEDFEANRRVGLGVFVTRDEMARQEGRTMSAVIGQFAGVRLTRGPAGQAWLFSSRGVKSTTGGGLCLPCPSSECHHLEDSNPTSCSDQCYPQVWLDNVPLSHQDIPNIDRLLPSQTEGLEYYAGGARTPPKYALLNSVCGVLVFHSRRP